MLPSLKRVVPLHQHSLDLECYLEGGGGAAAEGGGDDVGDGGVSGVLEELEVGQRG